MLLLLAITAATTTLTLGLALHGVTSQPVPADPGGDDRARTWWPPLPGRRTGRGRRPAAPGRLSGADPRPGVTGHSGPYPVAGAVLRAHGRTRGVEAEGRDQAPAAVDQPKLTAGSWVRPGGVVVERTFADALGVGVGDRVTLNGRPFRSPGSRSPPPGRPTRTSAIPAAARNVPAGTADPGTISA